MNPYVVTSSASSHSNRVTLPPMMIYPESDHLMKLEENQNYHHHHHHHQSSYTSSSLFHHSNLNGNGNFDSDYKSINLIPSNNFKTYIKPQDSMPMTMPMPIPIPIKPLQISHSTNNFNEQDHSQSPFSLHESQQTHHQPDQRLSLSLLLAAANASDANIPSTPSTSIHHVNQSPTNVYTQNPSSPSWSSNLTGSSDQIIPPSSPHTPLDTPTYSEGKMIHKAHYPIYSDEFDPRKLQEVHYPTYKNETIQEENLCPDEETWTSVSVMMRSNQSHQWSPDLPSPPPSITKSNDHQLLEAAEECVGKVIKKRKNKRSIPWTAEKPKQGKKKRSVGYVRPIIKHRKRVGQRLLDMLKNSPIPSKCPPMEVNRARCFPFAEMESKLNEWYGLQIEWPKDGNFRMDELRSTRRMRQDELDRLDQTLDSGLVRIRLADWVLEEEPFRFNEFSYPSDGSDSSLDEHDLIEFDSSNGLVERTLRPEMS